MKEIKTTNDLDRARAISKMTGYAIKDILPILRASETFELGQFSAGIGVKYGKNLTIVPVYKKARRIYDVRAKKTTYSTPHYVLELHTHNQARQALGLLDK